MDGDKDVWFLIRAPRPNIDLAEQYGRWATTPPSERKLQKYVADTWTTGRVMLLFAPNRAQYFCGAAEVLGMPGVMPEGREEPPWDAEGVKIGSSFDVHWEVRPSAKCEVSFKQLRSLSTEDDSMRDMTVLKGSTGQEILSKLHAAISEGRAAAAAAVLEGLDGAKGSRSKDGGDARKPLRRAKLKRRRSPAPRSPGERSESPEQVRVVSRPWQRRRRREDGEARRHAFGRRHRRQRSRSGAHGSRPPAPAARAKGRPRR